MKGADTLKPDQERLLYTIDGGQGTRLYLFAFYQ